MKFTLQFKSVVLALPFVLAFGIQAQVDPQLADQLQLTLDNELDNQGTIGISAAVYIPGQGMWLGTSGISSIAAVVNPVTQDMLFDYGSITKNYTAAVILQLEEEGLLSIDDSIYMFLPGLNNPYIDTNATLKQVMNMTSGIYDYTSNPAFFDSLFANPAACWQNNTMIDLYVDSLNYFAPGTGWSYCNTGFNLLGDIILNITGAPDLETVYATRFFNPLNLNSQQFGVCDLSTSGFANPWGDQGNGLEDMSWFSRNFLLTSSYSAGAMTGTAEDIALWNKAIFLDKVVLTQASLDSMLTFIPLQTSPSMWWNGFGLGTMRMESCGEEWYGYGGDILGYTSMGMYNPDDSVIIAFVMNQDNVQAGRVEMMAALCATVNAYLGINDVEELDQLLVSAQVSPNPFTDAVTVGFSLSEPENVRISVYDLMGNELSVLSEGAQSAGSHEFVWDGNGTAGPVAAGQYLVRLQAGDATVYKRIIKAGQ